MWKKDLSRKGFRTLTSKLITIGAVQVEDGFCFEQIVCFFIFRVQLVEAISLGIDLLYVLFQDRSSGDLYALLVCVIFGLRIPVQETCKPCNLLLVLFQDTNSRSS